MERLSTSDAHRQRAQDLLTLCRAPGLGAVRLASLLERFGSPSALCRADGPALRACGLPEETLAAIRKPDRRLRALDLAWLDDVNHHLLVFGDAEYPALLRHIAAAPPLLFAAGDPSLLDRPLVAVVGSRRPSHSGLAIAAELAGGLCAAGFGISSGLALGIDAASHAAALDAGGRAVAVLGCGIDRRYPARNRELQARIEAAGVVVSEFPPGTPPVAANFPRRNRIISGLSLGVLVVEAARRSGSLITARLAAEQGRDVFAVPGSVRNPTSAGCHVLLRDGAVLVETVDDMLCELQPGLLSCSPREERQGAAEQSGEVGCVLRALGYESVSMDTLLRRTTLTHPALSAILLQLEIAGEVVVRPGGNFERISSPRA